MAADAEATEGVFWAKRSKDNDAPRRVEGAMVRELALLRAVRVWVLFGCGSAGPRRSKVVRMYAVQLLLHLFISGIDDCTANLDAN